MSNNLLSPDKESVAFDVEGTLTRGAAWEGVRDYLVRLGEEDAYKAFQKRMTPRYLLYRLKLGNRQAFKEDWISGILALLAGHSRDDLQELGRQIVEQDLWPQRRQDVLDELHAQQEAGRQIVLVSGQFQPFLDAFVAQAGADAGIGTPGSWDNGRFSGELAAPFTVGERKVHLLRQALGESHLYAAYGDTGPDAPMLALSERPTAVYPDAPLERTAKDNNWRILAG